MLPTIQDVRTPPPEEPVTDPVNKPDPDAPDWGKNPYRTPLITSPVRPNVCPLLRVATTVPLTVANCAFVGHAGT